MVKFIQGKKSTQGLNIYRNPSDEIWRYNPRRRMNRATAEEYYAKRKYLEFPLHVIIEPTNYCNMICRMCLRNVMTRKKGFMDWNTFVKITNECSAHHVYSFSLYMLGEPLMHPRIRDMINYAKKMAVPYVDVSTNGLIDMLPLLGTALDELIISLDGIDNATYNRNRRGDYKKIEKNILDFLDKKDKGRYEYPFVRLQIIDMESNRPYLERFIKKWIKRVDLVYIKKLEGMVQGLGNKLVSPEMVKRECKNRQPCKQLFYTHNINWNGDHAFCCHDPFGYSVIGNIKNMSVKEAWNSRKKIAELERQNNNIFKGLCKYCIDYGYW